jgi:release factor glutamine methyltransferase
LTWRAVKERAAARLGSDLEARRILEGATGVNPGEWVLVLDEHPPTRQLDAFERMVERRATGEPLQYVLGAWGFRGLDLMVDARVLIPRPETEQVVEVAMAEVRRVAADRPAPVPVADLGTGSGAIALALAQELPDVEVWATDLSIDALEVARANLVGAGAALAGRVHLRPGDWFSALPGELRGALAVVVANPPYVAEHEQLPAEVGEWEPRQALFAGPSGLEALLHLVAEAPAWLAPGGALVLEFAPHQADVLIDRARTYGWGHVSVHTDLAGRDRVFVARCLL